MNYDNDYSHRQTSYSAHGGQNAGGFDPENIMSSQAGPSNARKYEDETMRPITIRSLQHATSKPNTDAFLLHTQPLTHLTLVGQIININVASTNTTFSLIDGTGVLSVKYWHTDLLSDADDGDAGAAWDKKGIRTHAWVRVYGKLKSFNEERSVQANKVVPILRDDVESRKGLDEVNAHFLECVAAYLYCTRGGLPASYTKGGSAGAANGVAAQEQQVTYGGYGPTGQAGMGGSTGVGGAGNPAVARLTGVSRRVYQAIATSGTAEGLHINNLAAQLKVPMNDIMKAGDELLGQSLIFQTVDDDTWGVMGD